MAKRRKRPQAFRFPGPRPQEALDYLGDKHLRPAFDFRDVSAQEHAAAFTVAKAMELDLLADIREAVRKALDEGRTFAQFRKDLEPELRKAGWWGRQEMTDRRTGETREVRLGSPRRLRIIYRSNLRAARAAGQWERIRRTAKTHPNLVYRLGPSREHRREHEAWEGTLLPADDEWWDDHATPNGWGCNCWIRQVSRAETENLGGVTDRPKRDPVPWTNPRTGRTIEVDRGLDPAWASNPGKDRQRLLEERLAWKQEEADEKVARASVAGVMGSGRLESFFDAAEAKAETHGKKSLSPAPTLAVAYLDLGWARALDARTHLVRLSERAANKLRTDHPEIGAQGVRDLLPAILRDAQIVVPETGHWGGGTDLVFAWRPPDSEKYYKLILGRDADRLVRLRSLYRAAETNIRKLLQREGAGEPLRNTPGWSTEPEEK